jgi:hypothetical protein
MPVMASHIQEAEMAGARRSRTGRSGRKVRSRKAGSTTTRLAWIGAAAVVLAVLIVPRAGLGSSHHPEPREGIDHTHVAPVERYADYPRVAAVYAQVAEIPHIVDGLYCYCECSEHSGHYSLLDCYKDNHAARCDVCLSEAAMAYRMHQDGASLDDIRTAIDRLYET